MATIKNTSPILKGIIILLSLTICISIASQGKYIKLFNEGNTSEANEIIDNVLSKKEADPCALFYKALILSDPKSSIYNPKQAYTTLENSKKNFNKEKNKEKFQKLGIDYSKYRKLNDSICKRALRDAQAINTEEAYLDYIAYYKKAPMDYVKKARSGLASDSYLNAKKKNTIEAYQAVIKRFGKSRYADSARVRIYALEYQKVERSKSVEDALNFIRKYPRAPQTEKIQDMVDSIEYVKTVKPNDWTTFRDYLNSHPESSLYERAEDSIFSIYKRTDDYDEKIDIAEYGATYFSGRHRIAILKDFHDIYTSDGDAITIKDFYDNYDDDIFENTRNIEIKLAKMADSLDLAHKFDPGKTKLYTRFINMAKDKEIAFVALQRLISLDLERKDYTQAIRTLKNHQNTFPKESNNYKFTTDLIELLKKPAESNIKDNFIGDVINTQGEEYSPVLTSNERSMLFCGKYRGDNIGGAKANNEDIFVSHKDKNGKWEKAKLDTRFSTDHNEAPLSISVDGNKIVIFRDGVICEANKTSEGWSDFKEMDYTINQNEWQSDACLTSDGRAILFAAENSDNYNTNLEHSYHGEFMHASDIYVVYYDDNDSLVGPVNLGHTINTRYSDRSPYLHADMKTLYFSSNGHGGLGHRDIYMSRKLSDTCWTCWSEPVNIGKEINSERDEIEYKVNMSGDKAYYHRNYKGNKNYDIFWTHVPQSARPDAVALIRGKVESADGKMLYADITWYDSNDRKMGQAKSDPTSGTFTIAMPAGKTYRCKFSCEGYKTASEEFDLSGRNEFTKIEGKVVRLSKE